jgi:hypothetical protein
MISIGETVASYIAAWNETDSERRRAVIARTWSGDGTYLDTHLDGCGHAAIDAMIAAVQQQFPAIAFGFPAASRRITTGCASVVAPVAPIQHNCFSGAPISPSSPRTDTSAR